MTQAYPLHWPEGWPRARARRSAPFKVPPQQARQEMMDELGRLGARNIIVSTDQPLNRDGSPSLVRRSISEPGVAVYFERKGRRLVLACDQYELLHDNMRAIGKTAEAMRGIERWGASDMLDRAFTGFSALAAPDDWRHMLGFAASQPVTVEEIDAAYRRLAKKAHPDTGGSTDAMARLTAARDAGRRAIG